MEIEIGYGAMTRLIQSLISISSLFHRGNTNKRNLWPRSQSLGVRKLSCWGCGLSGYRPARGRPRCDDLRASIEDVTVDFLDQAGPRVAPTT